jgi:hypothetical protein
MKRMDSLESRDPYYAQDHDYYDYREVQKKFVNGVRVHRVLLGKMYETSFSSTYLHI